MATTTDSDAVSCSQIIIEKMTAEAIESHMTTAMLDFVVIASGKTIINAMSAKISNAVIRRVLAKPTPHPGQERPDARLAMKIC
jgi:hypothetical protein